MWKRLVFSAIGLFLATPAHATGGFSCTIDDKNLTFEASSALGAGMGAPILNLEAKAVTRLKGTPEDLKTIDLKASLVHSWMDHPDLRLYFYMEREGAKPHGTFELVIKTKATGDDITYKGDYRLQVFYTEPPAPANEGAYIKARGKVVCEVE